MSDKGTIVGLHSGLTEKVLHAAFAVSNELGFGFFESVYRRSLLIALRQMGLAVEEEVAIPVLFRGTGVGVFYADLVVEKVLVLELKVGDAVTKEAENQLLHYLRSSDKELDLLLVFGDRGATSESFWTIITSTEHRRTYGEDCTLDPSHPCLIRTNPC